MTSGYKIFVRTSRSIGVNLELFVLLQEVAVAASQVTANAYLRETHS